MLNNNIQISVPVAQRIAHIDPIFLWHEHGFGMKFRYELKSHDFSPLYLNARKIVWYRISVDIVPAIGFEPNFSVVFQNNANSSDKRIKLGAVFNDLAAKLRTVQTTLLKVIPLLVLRYSP